MTPKCNNTTPTPDLAPTPLTENEKTACELYVWSVLPVSVANPNEHHRVLRKGADAIRTLERELSAAKELLREIRDDEVNASDEADKFLRDHQPSALSAAKADAEWLRNRVAEIRIEHTAELARLRAEVEQLKGLASWANTCTHHTDAERRRCGRVCPVCTSARAEKAEAALSEAQRQLVIETYTNQKLRAENKGLRKSVWHLRGIVVAIARLVRPNPTEKTAHAVQRLVEENESFKNQSAKES